MSWDGHLPKGVTCTRCGAVLQGAGEGRPAESYLGTYTGLCYPCNDRPAEPTGEVDPSGAREWTHPPDCPSWRRDRRTFLAFDGCPRCRGTGAVRESSPGPFGGTYLAWCPDCRKRYLEHPATIARQEEDNRRLEARRAWCARANAELNRRAIALGIDPEEWKAGGDPEVDRKIRAIIDDLRRECPEPEDGTPAKIPEGWAHGRRRK